MRILVVEDELHLSEALSHILKKNNYTVDVANDGETGLDDALSGIYDVIVLDIMLPKTDGITVLKTLRSEGFDTPVILLTAKNEIPDKVLGLDSGADDYMVKPFGVMELLSRVKAVLRRSGKETASSTLSAGDITLDASRRQVTVAGEAVTLTRKEFDLLETLMRNRGLVLTREKLLDTVWGIDFPGDTRTVDVHMGTLRQKLGAGAAMLQTVRGVGYRMED